MELSSVTDTRPRQDSLPSYGNSHNLPSVKKHEETTRKPQDLHSLGTKISAGSLSIGGNNNLNLQNDQMIATNIGTHQAKEQNKEEEKVETNTPYIVEVTIDQQLFLFL